MVSVMGCRHGFLYRYTVVTSSVIYRSSLVGAICEFSHVVEKVQVQVPRSALVACNLQQLTWTQEWRFPHTSSS